jgi:hypothetical protein
VFATPVNWVVRCVTKGSDLTVFPGVTTVDINYFAEIVKSAGSCQSLVSLAEPARMPVRIYENFRDSRLEVSILPYGNDEFKEESQTPRHNLTGIIVAQRNEKNASLLSKLLT